MHFIGAPLASNIFVLLSVARVLEFGRLDWKVRTLRCEAHTNQEGVRKQKREYIYLCCRFGLEATGG